MEYFSLHERITLSGLLNKWIYFLISVDSDILTLAIFGAP